MKTSLKLFYLKIFNIHKFVTSTLAQISVRSSLNILSLIERLDINVAVIYENSLISHILRAFEATQVWVRNNDKIIDIKC